MSSFLLQKLDEKTQKEMADRLWSVTQVSLVKKSLKLKCESETRMCTLLVTDPQITDESVDLQGACVMDVIVQSCSSVWGHTVFYARSISLETGGETYVITSAA